MATAGRSARPTSEKKLVSFEVIFKLENSFAQCCPPGEYSFTESMSHLVYGKVIFGLLSSAPAASTSVFVEARR